MASAAALLGLVRWPGAVTAAGNAATCFLLAHRPDSAGGTAAALGAVAGGALVYAGGVVLNDVADSEKDRTAHPARPIPSGAVTRAAAANLGFALLVLGALAVLLLANAEAAAFTAAAALGAVLYDFVGRKLPAAGMVFLGFARAANAAAGAVAAAGSVGVLLHGDGPAALAVVHPVAVFAYTAVLTWISTFEESPQEGRAPGHARFLSAAFAVCLFTVAAFSWAFFPRGEWPESPGIAFLFLAGTLAAAARESMEPDGPGLGALVRAGVFGFLLLDAAWLFGAGRYDSGFYAVLVYVLLRLVLMRSRS